MVIMLRLGSIMKILVTGSNGMVGTELKKHLDNAFFFKHFNYPDLDVTNRHRTQEIIEYHRPDVIIHLAAKTDVDWCEYNPEECFAVNVEGARNVCEGAQKVKALLVFPSTFYVYPGDKESPYDERYDKVIPDKIIGTYSKSKWIGEVVVSEFKNMRHLIVRFGSLFGGGEKDKKFVSKVLRMVSSGVKEIRMIDNRFIQPSSVKDTARNLLSLIEKGGEGVFNMVGHGTASYFEYAKAVLEFAGVKDVKVISINSKDFKETAPRAFNLSAVNGRLGEMGLDRMRDWRLALKEYIEEIKSQFIE